MIRLRIDGDGSAPPLFMFGITDLNVERLVSDQPIKINLGELGGHDTFAIFHAPDAEGLRQQLAKILSREDLAALTSSLDQLGASEREARARNQRVLLKMDATEARALWHAAATAVQLMDAVDAEPGNAIPPHAPLYGQRDRLLAVARRLDHECNQVERAGRPCHERTGTAAS